MKRSKVKGKILVNVFICLMIGLIFNSLPAVEANSYLATTTPTGFYYPTGKPPVYDPPQKYGYDGACTYYDCPGWLAREDDYWSGYYHIGQDIEANVEDNVYAISDGLVRYISHGGWGTDNVGIFVKHKLNDGTEFLALYGHIRSSVKVGDDIDGGKSFATIGPFGNEPHLHFGIHSGTSLPPSSSSEKIGWGRMGIKHWPNTNGFVDPLAWITTKIPFGLPPIASFTFSPENPIVDEEVTFDASASHDPDGGEIKNYRWEFYRLTEYVPFPLIWIVEGSDKKVIKYSFFPKGAYLVRLIVADDEGEINWTEKTLATTDVNILSPTQASPATVGDYSDPNPFEAIIEVKDGITPITGLTDLNFTFKISNKSAIASLTDTSLPGQYVFNITPPKQDAAGKYDLEVSVQYSGSTFEDIEQEAVTYTSLEAKPVLTSPLRITPEKDKYYVGDTLRAEFTIKNIGGAPITLNKLLVGGRFNDGRSRNREYPDFTSQTTTLQPDGQYRYNGTLTLTRPGNYHFFIAYYIENPTSEEKKLLDENNWNTCVGLGERLTDADRIEDIRAFSVPPPLSLIFSDDFSSDSGEWTYVETVCDIGTDEKKSGSAYLDDVNEHIVLTKSDWQVGVIWFNQEIYTPFAVEFRYKAGGGSGADGLVFMFYKQKDYDPYNGGALGFTTPPGGSSSSTPVPGYGIEFDNFNNGFDGGVGQFDDPSGNHIALIKDSVGNHIKYVEDPRTEDDQWHNVKIIVGYSTIEVYVDSELVLTWEGEIDRTYGCLGFSGATGYYDNWHIIDDVKILA